LGQPGHTDPIPLIQSGARGPEAIDDAHHLVTRYDLGVVGLEVTFSEVEVGPTDPAHSDRNRTCPAPVIGIAFSTPMSGPVSIGPGWSTTHARIIWRVMG
jgi:hypothetical protein